MTALWCTWDALDDNPVTPISYIAPSWSWASIPGAVNCATRNVLQPFSALATITKYSINLDGQDQFGQVKPNSSITLSAFVDAETTHVIPGLYYGGVSKYLPSCVLPKQYVLWYIILGVRTTHRKGASRSLSARYPHAIVGLILTSATSQNPEKGSRMPGTKQQLFRRVGTFECQNIKKWSVLDVPSLVASLRERRVFEIV
jgi:hypothetical protein